MNNAQEWWKRNDNCKGCFDSTSKNFYGSCEGCVNTVDFQLKCFNILNKVFSLKEGKLIQEQFQLEKEEEDFLIALLSYNRQKKELKKKEKERSEKP